MNRTARDLWAWLGMRRTGVIERSHLVEGPRRRAKVTWALSDEDKRKGRLRPLRYVYLHETCGALTKVSVTTAEFMASQPYAFKRAYCAHCRAQFAAGPDGEFTWKGSTERVGS